MQGGGEETNGRGTEADVPTPPRSVLQRAFLRLDSERVGGKQPFVELLEDG